MKFDLEKHFFDKDDNSVIIKAGSTGWQILYADGSDKTVEKKATAQENFDEAFEYAIEKDIISSDLDEEDAEVCCETGEDTE